VNETIETIIDRSMAEADRRRDEIVERKLARAAASERMSALWGRVAGWSAAIAAVGWVACVVLVLLP
jgi:negative regulator of sigma E activity